MNLSVISIWQGKFWRFSVDRMFCAIEHGFAYCTLFEFSIQAMVWGYHIYQDEWDAVIGEVMQCRRETGNRHDPYAVATLSDGKMSRWTYVTKHFACLLNLYSAWWLYHLYS